MAWRMSTVVRLSVQASFCNSSYTTASRRIWNISANSIVPASTKGRKMSVRMAHLSVSGERCGKLKLSTEGCPDAEQRAGDRHREDAGPAGGRKSFIVGSHGAHWIVRKVACSKRRDRNAHEHLYRSRTLSRKFLEVVGTLIGHLGREVQRRANHGKIGAYNLTCQTTWTSPHSPIFHLRVPRNTEAGEKATQSEFAAFVVEKFKEFKKMNFHEKKKVCALFFCFFFLIILL